MFDFYNVYKFDFYKVELGVEYLKEIFSKIKITTARIYELLIRSDLDIFFTSGHLHFN